jgi:2-haloacid dehalogenase
MNQSEINRENIDACVFDAYGTLFNVHAAAAKLKGELDGKADQLSQIWRTKQLEYTWLRSLMGNYAPFWQITGDALDYALGVVKIDNPDLRQKLMDVYMQLDAYPEAADVLGKLKAAGLKTAILSNGSPEMLASAVNNAGLSDSLDAVLSVDGLKIFKPHPSVYQLSVDELGVEAGKICFMSSNAWDIAGGSHFGYQAVWVNRFGAEPERLPNGPIAEIESLDGLLELLI